MDLLKALRPLSDHITLACTGTDSDLADDLEPLGIQKRTIVVNDSSFDEFISQLNPELVIFDRYVAEEQFGWRVAEICPDAMRVLNT